MGTIKTTNGLAINGVTAIDIASAGAIQINSTGGALSMGNDNDAQAINIGTGSAARTITLGNTTGASACNVHIGTGDLTMTSASGTLISQLDTGEMTQPLQSSFLAYLASDDNNITGGGGTYQMGTNVAFTEVFDLNSDFNTNGTYTAPLTARYYIVAAIKFGGLTTEMVRQLNGIVTSNRQYLFFDKIEAKMTPSNIASFTISVLADMDIGDTAHVDAHINGSLSGNIADALADSAATMFCACLIC